MNITHNNNNQNRNHHDNNSSSSGTMSSSIGNNNSNSGSSSHRNTTNYDVDCRDTRKYFNFPYLASSNDHRNDARLVGREERFEVPAHDGAQRAENIQRRNDEALGRRGLIRHRQRRIHQRQVLFQDVSGPVAKARPATNTSPSTGKPAKKAR